MMNSVVVSDGGTQIGANQLHIDAPHKGAYCPQRELPFRAGLKICTKLTDESHEAPVC